MVTISNFREEQYPATDEMQCVTVYIPAGDEFKQLLAGLLALPCRWENYQDAESAQTDGLVAIWQDAYDVTDWEGCLTPVQTELNLMLLNATVLAGNSIIQIIDTSMRFNGYARQNPAANSDAWRFDRWVDAGDWEYRITYLRNTTNGILQFSIVDAGTNVVENVTFDMRGSLLANQFITGAFAIQESGMCQIFGTCVGSSSTGHFIPIASIEMWKIP